MAFESSVLTLDVQGHVATLWLDRVDARNAMGRDLWTDLPRAAAEVAGRDLALTLLTLDTAEGGAGERLYARGGWTRVGVIPDYALMPDGGLTGTVIFFKRIDA